MAVVQYCQILTYAVNIKYYKVKQVNSNPKSKKRNHKVLLSCIEINNMLLWVKIEHPTKC